MMVHLKSTSRNKTPKGMQLTMKYVSYIPYLHQGTGSEESRNPRRSAPGDHRNKGGKATQRIAQSPHVSSNLSLREQQKKRKL